MNIKKKLNYIVILSILILFPLVIKAQQSISGTFPNLANQQLKLIGFDGFKTYTIDSVKISEKGVFQIQFSTKDFGMGYLAAEDNKAFIVILAANENLKIKGEALAFPKTIVITSGKQNQQFAQYATEHPRREQALSAWDYLEKIYRLDSLFAIHKSPIKSIDQEKQRIKKEDKAFLASLNSQTYVSWFLPVRKLISSVSTIAQYRTEEIPATIAAFRKMDYTAPRLYKSGLLRESIESHFWLIENSGRSLDSVFIEMSISIDFMMEKLATDEKKLNEISEFLFKTFEKRSLFGASEYLALKVLNEKGCTINKNLAGQMESYRSMKIGNIAPDFAFEDDCFAPSYEAANSPKKLSDIKSKYTVIVFGASWCPSCPEELSQISPLYKKWKTHGVEVVFVSLDEDKQTFKNFTSIFPFISICDYKKWDSPTMKSYHIFATPTIYLLDNKQEILLRPNSVKQMDGWVDWYLVQGNKIKKG